MASDDDFTAQIGEIGARIGGILRDDMDRQRQENAANLRAGLEEARTKAGGEIAEALLQVMLVANRWTGEAMKRGDGIPVIPYSVAVAEITAAIEAGLRAAQL